MRLIVLTTMGLIVGLGLAAAIVAVPVMAQKGPLQDTLVAHLGGAQEKEVSGGGDLDGEGRAVVKVFKEQLCGRVETSAIESSSLKATIHLGMSGEKGPTVANLEEQAATPTTGTTDTTGTTTGTTGTTTGITTPTTGTTTSTTGTTGTTSTTGTTTGITTPTTGTTTSTTGTMGAQTGTTTTTGDTTLAEATTPQTTTLSQSSPSPSTASPTASASASASAATILEHTGGCVAMPRALSLELLEHPQRFYVNVTNGQYPEGAIRGQLHRSGAAAHRSGNNDD